MPLTCSFFLYPLSWLRHVSPVKRLWWTCSQTGESPRVKHRKASYLITLSETHVGGSTSSVSIGYF